nr:ubiquitin hydrolase [Tanacetum cinerariifolium]
IKKEKEGLDSKLTGFQTSSKDLESLLESQRFDKNKEGLGYSAVPPPLAQIYSSPKKDLSWTGLLEFADDTVTDYSRPAPTVESSPDDAPNRNPSVTATEASPSAITSKAAIKFVKVAERPTTDKVETTKKPAVKYAELYRKTTKRSTVRGNQRNWNNLKSQQLGENFVMKNKACFNCGHFDHLSYNCGLGVKMGRSSPKNNYTHRSMPPRPAIHRPYRPPMRPVRPNMNAAQPKRTSFYKPAHSYNKRATQGQNWKTQCGEKETEGRIVGNKMRYLIPTANDEDSTVSEKSFPLLSSHFDSYFATRVAPAEEFALLVKIILSQRCINVSQRHINICQQSCDNYARMVPAAAKIKERLLSATITLSNKAEDPILVSTHDTDA